MFGASFSELALIGLIALLVLGPDRLPQAAKTAGLWLGRAKRTINSIKLEIEREVGADEIRARLQNEHISQIEREAFKKLNTLTPTPSGADPMRVADPLVNCPAPLPNVVEPRPAPPRSSELKTHHE